ncbi:MAG: hypothetical protein PHU23_15960 [Dehalococcoidales bacterium]|nr:hypothetical protein [Dehalococcoidales bacterium]
MKIVVHLTLDGLQETVLEGDCGLFGSKIDQMTKGYDKSLRDIGFWLDDWRCYPSRGRGASNKSRVFIPWGSCLYVETMEETECPSTVVHGAR